VARNLDGLYDYMVRTLVDANVHNDEAKLLEVRQLLAEVKAGWDAIPPEYHDPRTAPPQTS
jgi:flagellar protein FliS